MRIGRVGLAALGLALLVAVPACGDDDGETVSATTPPPTTAAEEPALGDDGAGLPEEPPQEELDALYVGLTKEEAAEVAEERGVPWRIVREDGEDFVVTMDYVPLRVNFTVEDGIVVAVEAG